MSSGFDINLFREGYQNNSGEILVHYKGILTPSTINQILRAAELKIENDPELNSSSRKMFNVLVECLQNMYHHFESSDSSPNGGKPSGEVILSKEPGYLNIVTANSILSENRKPLEDKLDLVNEKNLDELRDLYDDELRNRPHTSKGGGNLGLMDMKKKTGSDLDYGFRQLDNLHDIFSLRVKIQTGHGRYKN